jgi:hypothetical protein
MYFSGQQASKSLPLSQLPSPLGADQNASSKVGFAETSVVHAKLTHYQHASCFVECGRQ